MSSRLVHVRAVEVHQTICALVIAYEREKPVGEIGEEDPTKDRRFERLRHHGGDHTAGMLMIAVDASFKLDRQCRPGRKRSGRLARNLPLYPHRQRGASARPHATLLPFAATTPIALIAAGFAGFAIARRALRRFVAKMSAPHNNSIRAQ